jgi:hypothetical protein
VLDWFSEFGRLTGGYVSGGVKCVYKTEMKQKIIFTNYRNLDSSSCFSYMLETVSRTADMLADC